MFYNFYLVSQLRLQRPYETFWPQANLRMLVASHQHQWQCAIGSSHHLHAQIFVLEEQIRNLEARLFLLFLP